MSNDNYIQCDNNVYDIIPKDTFVSYTYRSECEFDDLKFYIAIMMNGFKIAKIETNTYYDFSNILVNAPLYILRNIANNGCEDCHVIAQTINLSHLYTGERNFTI